MTDYDTAVKQAVKEKKSLLVLFTGSDWCPGCIALYNNTLNTEKFIRFAQKNLILVYMDSPRNRFQGITERAMVKKLERKLEPGPYIPATVIVSNDGRILGRISGYRDVDDYIKQIEGMIK
jgi:thiol-disulfide isomerase/thioredoxin